MSDRWIGGFLNNNNPIFGFHGDREFATFSSREQAAESVGKTTQQPIIVASCSGIEPNLQLIYEAKRDSSGLWTFSRYPDLSRMFP